MTTTSILKLTGTAVLLAGALPAQHNQLTPQEKKQGWILLFDGKSFDNWEDPARKSPPGDSFTIEDGCLKATSKPRFNEDLFTRDRFRDFELVFDWRISRGGNSGVKFRIQDRIWVKPVKGMKFEDTVALSYKNRDDARPDRGQQYVVGFEYQCIDNEENPDGRLGGSHSSGALYDIVAPATQAVRPVGEFNHTRIVVKGSHAEHWLNGIKVVDTTLDSTAVAQSAEKRWGKDSQVARLLIDQPVKECPISLQNHNDEAWFRDIKIRRLK